MKMILAIVPDKAMDDLIDACLQKQIRFTRVASSGGFLKAGNSTVILGIKEERISEIKGIFQKLGQDLKEEERIHVMIMAGDAGRHY